MVDLRDMKFNLKFEDSFSFYKSSSHDDRQRFASKLVAKILDHHPFCRARALAE